MQIFRDAVTRYAGLSRPAAIAVIGVTLAAIAFLLVLAVNQVAPLQAKSPEQGDLAMYQRLVGHMRQGADYYAAARTELLNGGYGMKSVFNWRTPLLADFIALFPSQLIPQIILMGIALAAAATTCTLIFKAMGLLGVEIALVVLTISLGACVPLNSVLMSEIVVGPLLLLSISAYGLRRPYLGLVVALLALFLRELAAPYIVICIGFACWERRPRELAAWAVGLVAYGGYYLWHYHMVQLHVLAQDPADVSGWVQFGGAGFVLATAAFNGVMIVAPNWLSAVLFPLCLLGILGWPGRVGIRFATVVLGYVALFSVVGKPFDTYWGALYMPIASMGLVWLPVALRDLWRTLNLTASAAAEPTGA